MIFVIELTMDMNSKVANRQSNFELLRIFSMYIIIIHHFCIHGIYTHWNTNVTLLNHINNVLLQILNLGGKIGVDIFILITGFFMIDSKFKLNSFLKVFLTTLFYSVLFVIIALVFGLDIPVKHLIQILFPLDKNSYWFIASYLVLYLFIPFINVLLNNISKKQFKYLISLSLVLWSILITEYSFLCWFFTLYAIGGFIKKCNPPPEKLNISTFLISSFFILSIFFTIFLFSILKNPIKLHNYEMNNILILLLSISIFFIFKELKIPQNKIINYISASVFSVYLIHDNNIIRPILWETIHANYFITVPYFIIMALVIPFVIFILCILIDKVLSKIYQPAINFITDKISLLFTFFEQQQQRNQNKT